MSQTALATYPVSYSKVCDTFRPRRATARRTDLGRHSFVYFLKPSPVLNSFIAEHITEGRPSCIQYGLGQVGFSQPGGIHVTDGDVIKLLNQFPRFLVQKVGTLIHDFGVNRDHLPSLVGTLRKTQLGFQRPVVALVLNLLTGRKRGEVFQTQINTNTANGFSGGNVSDLDHHIQKPVPLCIPSKARAVLDPSFRQRAGIKHAESVAVEPEGVPFSFEITPFKRHPTQRLLAAITQIRALLLRSGFRVLLTGCVDRARVQAQFLATAGGEFVQIKATGPAFMPLQSKLLGVVAEIPNEIHRAALLIQQAVQGFNAVTEHLNHLRIITYFSNGHLKTDRPADGSLSLPGMNAGVSRGDAG
jgi:hypothetical protein